MHCHALRVPRSKIETRRVRSMPRLLRFHRPGSIRAGVGPVLVENLPFARRWLLETVKSVEVGEAHWSVVVIVNGNRSFGNPPSGAVAKRPHPCGIYDSAETLQVVRGYWLHCHLNPTRLIGRHSCWLNVLVGLRQGFTLSQTSGCQRNLAGPLRCKGA